MTEAGKIRPGGQRWDFFMAGFPSVGNLLIAPGCCLVPEAVSAQPMGVRASGCCFIYLFIYLAASPAVVAAVNPFIACHNTWRY